jgi:hypothetical protein
MREMPCTISISADQTAVATFKQWDAPPTRAVGEGKQGYHANPSSFVF